LSNASRSRPTISQRSALPPRLTPALVSPAQKGDQSTIGPGAHPFRAGANDYFDRYDWLGRSQGRLNEVSKLESHPREAAMPQIAVINESTAISDADVPAFEQQWNKDLGPVWDVEAAAFTFVPTGGHAASRGNPDRHCGQIAHSVRAGGSFGTTLPPLENLFPCRIDPHRPTPNQDRGRRARAEGDGFLRL
jgi:hypothetical protein